MDTQNETNSADDKKTLQTKTQCAKEQTKLSTDTRVPLYLPPDVLNNIMGFAFDHCLLNATLNGYKSSKIKVTTSPQRAKVLGFTYRERDYIYEMKRNIYVDQYIVLAIEGRSRDIIKMAFLNQGYLNFQTILSRHLVNDGPRMLLPTRVMCMKLQSTLNRVGETSVYGKVFKDGNCNFFQWEDDKDKSIYQMYLGQKQPNICLHNLDFQV